MQIRNKEILFESPAHCREFLSELRLIGEVRLSRAVADHAGSVMVRERIIVRQTLLERLRTAPESQVGVEVSEALLVRVRGELTARVLSHIEQPQNAFLRRLLSNLQRSPRPYVLYAFQSRPLALSAIRLTREDPQLFDRMVTTGLLSLGVLLQRDQSLPLIHRHAFLAGFACWPGCDEDSGRGVSAADEPADLHELIERSAQLVDRFRLPEGFRDIWRGLRDAPLPLRNTHARPAGTEKHPDRGDHSLERERVDPEAVPVLTESLRIALFAEQFCRADIATPQQLRGLVHRLANESARERLNRRLTGAVLQRFGEYQTAILKSAFRPAALK